MGAIDERRKVVQKSLAPDFRTLTAEIRSLGGHQALLRSELAASEARSSEGMTGADGRTRAEILASEARVTAAIDRIRQDWPLLVRNAVLEAVSC